MIQIKSISFRVLLIRFPYSNTVVHASNTPGHARASKCRLPLFDFSNNTEVHDSFYSEIIFTRKRGARFYLRLPFQLATPPPFHATHIPKGNLVIQTKSPKTSTDLNISPTTKKQKTDRYQKFAWNRAFKRYIP